MKVVEENEVAIMRLVLQSFTDIDVVCVCVRADDDYIATHPLKETRGEPRV